MDLEPIEVLAHPFELHLPLVVRHQPHIPTHLLEVLFLTSRRGQPIEVGAVPVHDSANRLRLLSALQKVLLPPFDESLASLRHFTLQLDLTERDVRAFSLLVAIIDQSHL